ncbi:MAG: type I 3-dehydroquinate dehydratase [Clostridia bacterium]|nr:type I 3-dehydroquinate dehydratase [Clostridia bacterium]
MKATFLQYQKPLLCCMIPENTPDRAISAIMNAHYDGAEAFGFQLEGWKPEHLGEETLRQVFKYCLGKPIYVTSYRHHSNEGKTDDECAEVLFTAIRAGATLVDVMADFYDPQPYEITYNEEAVAKQKALIEKLHAAGAEVLMSSHTHTHIDEDGLVQYAKAQRERGADICKIVNFDTSEADTDENFRAILRIKREVGGKFLFLCSGGNCHQLRQIGPSLGVCMWLCVQNAVREQPQLRAMKQVKDNLFYNC